VSVMARAASAIQTVPFLGRDAKHLYFFPAQRPSSVGLRVTQADRSGLRAACGLAGSATPR